jgi:putative ABC exporter
MLEDIAALAYLDYRAFVNGVRAIVREPKRLIAWAFYLILVGNAWLQRSMQRRIGASGWPDHTWLSSVGPVVLALLPAALLALIGYGVLTAGLRRRPKIGFSTPADGRFLVGSKLSPRVVAGWLQFRTLGALAVRWPLLVLIFFGFPGIAQMPAAVVFAGGFAILAALLLNWQIANAAALLSRRAPIPWIVAGATMLAIAIGALATPVLAAIREPGRLVDALSTHGVSFVPGSWLVSALEGHAWGTVALFAAAAVAGIVATSESGDSYPEIWQTSARLFVLRRIAGRGAFWQSIGDSSIQRQLDAADQKVPARPRSRIAASTRDSALTGAWTLLWKDWIAFLRAPVGSWGPGVRVVFIIVLSAGIGIVVGFGGSEGFGGRAALVGFSIAGLIWYVQFLALTSAAIVADLRMPIWSLSAAGLPMRLLAWTAASSWRPAVGCTLAFVALGIAGGVPAIALAGLPVAILVTWATRVVGLAAFTILPNQSDVRGPAAMLRVFMIYLLMAPAVVAGIVAQLIGGLAAAIVCATVVLIAECACLLLFAATRLEGNMMAYAGATATEDRS